MEKQQGIAGLFAFPGETKKQKPSRDYFYQKQKHQKVKYDKNQTMRLTPFPQVFLLSPKDHWTLETGYFEDPTPAIQVQTLPLEGPRSLGRLKKNYQKTRDLVRLSILIIHFKATGERDLVELYPP